MVVNNECSSTFDSPFTAIFSEAPTSLDFKLLHIHILSFQALEVLNKLIKSTVKKVVFITCTFLKS